MKAPNTKRKMEKRSNKNDLKEAVKDRIIKAEIEAGGSQNKHQTF